MEKINKYQTGVILLAVVLGLLLGNLAILERYASSFIVLLLMVMLYGLFLSINIGELKSAFFNLKFSAKNRQFGTFLKTRNPTRVPGFLKIKPGYLFFKTRPQVSEH